MVASKAACRFLIQNQRFLELETKTRMLQKLIFSQDFFIKNKAQNKAYFQPGFFDNKILAENKAYFQPGSFYKKPSQKQGLFSARISYKKILAQNTAYFSQEFYKKS